MEVIEWRSQVLGWLSAALFRECMCWVSKADELTSVPSRIADSANRCVAFISDGVQGLTPGRAVKNLDTRCEGLSPFLFVYSITGNTTYTLSILAASLDVRHIVANAPWIAGAYISAYGSETHG